MFVNRWKMNILIFISNLNQKHCLVDIHDGRHNVCHQIEKNKEEQSWFVIGPADGIIFCYGYIVDINHFISINHAVMNINERKANSLSIDNKRVSTK